MQSIRKKKNIKHGEGQLNQESLLALQKIILSSHKSNKYFHRMMDFQGIVNKGVVIQYCTFMIVIKGYYQEKLPFIHNGHV